MKGQRAMPEPQKTEGEEPEVDPDLFNKKLLFTTLNAADERAAARRPEEPKPEAQRDESANYKWLKIIGQGTFGVVYKAEELASGRTVAIKKVFQDPKYSNREFKVVGELDHPNCIKVHHFFFSRKAGSEKDVDLNLVMDYVPDTLYKILRFYFKKSYDFPNALGKIYAYQMFRALAYIHNAGICHHDIKPQNILVNIQDHRLVLCDFGSAKLLRPGEASVAYICSRYYRAPELILGEERYDLSIDVWSIGCVIAEMFLGEPIFCGKNSKDQFLKIMQVLGTPTAAEVRSMCQNVSANLPEVKGVGLRKKLGKADPLLVDLLAKTLTYNPKKRAHPFALLAHPYFDDLRAQRLTINGRDVTDLFNFNATEVGAHGELARRLTPHWYNS